MTYTFIIKAFIIYMFTSSTDELRLNQNYFEGIITYKVKTLLKVKDHPANEYFLQKYSDTLEFYVNKKGDFKRHYKGFREFGMDWNIYLKDKNEYYAKWHNMDSIFYYECSEIVTELISIDKGESKKILGETCQSITLIQLEPNLQETITSTYYYSGNQTINQGIFNNFKESYFNKIYEISNSHFLKWEFENLNTHVTFEAINIERKKLEDEIFEVPNNITMVKW
jgi:hypothetical protein